MVAYDYAMNQCAYRVTLPENAVTRITLDQTAVTLPQKGYVQLNATVTPDDATDQNLVWSSSDSSVAEVKNGIVAAKAPGTATITVKSSVWPDVKAQCQITVTDEVGADVPMSEFRLNTSSVTMLAGTTYTNVRLYAYAPFYATDLNLEWTSSDESVVTVEPNGEGDQLTQYAKLTALKPGTATVTAKAKNGTATYDLAVTVTEATGSGSFNIVGDTLVSYSGTESTVTIPDGVRVIGERINPTGKKRFKQALIENDMDYIINQGIEQAEAGADILDVNVGLPEIDEPEMMIKTVKNLQSVLDLPLQLDSSDPSAIEAGLRIYNGKPIVNSVNGEPEVMHQIFPLIKKYGAAVVGLTLDDRGIPAKAEERFAIAQRIVDTALSYGIPREDVFIDCLTLTVSAQQKEASETLKAVRDLFVFKLYHCPHEKHRHITNH